jgi:hypothetical protein
MTAAPPVEAWTPWSPAEVAARFAFLDVPWCVVGGWALDLFAGYQRRPHEDLEVAVPAVRFPGIAARLAGADFSCRSTDSCTAWRIIPHC